MNEELVLLDGATGTELSRRGADTRLPLWSAKAPVEAPELLVTVHRDYLRAGCRVLTACTFRTHERSLAKGGWGGRSDELNAAALSCARQAIAAEGAEGARRAEGVEGVESAEGVRVAGSLAPLEDCYRPDLVPEPAALEEEHARQAQSLAAAGSDLLLVETMATRREARAALRAALATGLPAWCSFISDGRGRLLSGESLAEAAAEAAALGAEAVLVNCLPVVDLRADVERLGEALSSSWPGLRFGAYGNLGHAHEVEGWRADLMLEPDRFAGQMLDCLGAGASLLGGCCGTEPRHLAALGAALAARLDATLDAALPRSPD